VRPLRGKEQLKLKGKASKHRVPASWGAAAPPPVSSQVTIHSWRFIECARCCQSAFTIASATDSLVSATESWLCLLFGIGIECLFIFKHHKKYTGIHRTRQRAIARKGTQRRLGCGHPGELMLLLRFRLKWLFTVEDLLNVRDAASLPLPSPPPRIPWYLPLKVGSVCSLALVLSVYLFSSIIKNTQAYTEPDREP